MSVSIGSGGAWRGITNLSVGASSAWRQAQNMWVGVGGVWKLVWQYLAVDALPAFLFNGGDDGTNGVAYEINSGGYVLTYVDTTSTDIGYWLLSGTASDYEARLTVTTGSTPGGSAVNTWINCATDPSWSLTVNATSPSYAEAAGEYLLELRDQATLDVLDSAVITMEVNAGLVP